MRTTLLGALLTTALAATAGEVTFVKPPAQVRKGETLSIHFQVSAATDVEVAIIDAKGTVVRHLAAGVLGENPPPPLVKGLSQVIVWDGKDDCGKPLTGSYRARVRLGSRPKLGKVLLYAPGISFSPRAVSVGP
ncbi:MAG: hypothetical protein ACYTGB_18305, partial [Planctomycetota bacterium]